MFWKKQKPEADLTRISHDSQNKRDAFRYVFKKQARPKSQFLGKDIRLLDISAGGLAFKNNGFSQFDSDFIQFELELPNALAKTDFIAGLRILRIDNNNICHCIFEQCSLEQHELLHKYVLEMQKNDLAH